MKRIIVSLLTLFFATSLFAQNIPDKPNPPRLVNDFANVLSNSQVNQLEAELNQFEQTTSTQIAIVTVSNLEGYAASDYAIRLHEKWEVGQKGKDNGIVILFKPKTSNEKGQVFISVGYGLEGVIPDAIAHRDIVDTEMIPRFKQNDIFGGLYYGTKVLMSLSSGEFSAADYHRAVKGKKKPVLGGLIFFILIFFISRALFGSRRRYYSGGSSLPFWLAMGLMSSGRSSHSGSWSDFSGGGGSFGGFGGGMTGGGGAGGSW